MLGKATYGRAGKTTLDEASHDRAGKVALIKIHVKIGCSPLGGDAIQSGGSLKIAMVV